MTTCNGVELMTQWTYNSVTGRGRLVCKLGSRLLFEARRLFKARLLFKDLRYETCEFSTSPEKCHYTTLWNTNNFLSILLTISYSKFEWKKRCAMLYKAVQWIFSSKVKSSQILYAWFSHDFKYFLCKNYSNRLNFDGDISKQSCGCFSRHTICEWHHHSNLFNTNFINMNS